MTSDLIEPHLKPGWFREQMELAMVAAQEASRTYRPRISGEWPSYQDRVEMGDTEVL